MAHKKYFKTRKEALEFFKLRPELHDGIFKMPKGTRKHGWYFVGTYLEFLSLS